MNPHQLSAIVRMRWRITSNRFARSGFTNQVLFALLVVVITLAAIGGFVAAAFLSRAFLAKIGAPNLIYVWDMLILAFLFSWMTVILTELQRSELLSLKNLLHLPVSLFGAFALNYISSLVSVTLLVAVPIMFGLAFAGVIQFGTGSAITFVLIVSYLFMITAVTYQLRGYMARLMENKRTRGTVIVVTTMISVTLFQIPMLLNSVGLRSWISSSQERRIENEKDLHELEQRHASGAIDSEEYRVLLTTILNEHKRADRAVEAQEQANLREITVWIHRVLPPLWLAYGAGEAARGQALVPLLCLLGMSGIGFASLALSYRSTLRASQGEGSKKQRDVKPPDRAKSSKSMLQWNFPFLSDTQSAIMMATIRSVSRAPEAKMAMMTPLIFALIFGSIVMSGPLPAAPRFVRQWVSLSAIAMSLVGVAQLQFNMFGLDRQGFRAYVLMPARRRDILIGKNFAAWLMGGSLTLCLVLVVGMLVDSPASHYVANGFQILIAFLLYSIVTNSLSIVAPLAMASGSTKPRNIRFTAGILQFIAILGCPLVLLPAGIALGAETVIHFFYDLPHVPFYLIFTLLELPAAIFIYRTAVRWQGQHLQQREQAILEEISKVFE